MRTSFRMVCSAIILFSLLINAQAGKIVVIGASTAAGTGPKSINNAWAWRYETYLKSYHDTLVHLAVGGWGYGCWLPTGTTPPAGFDAVQPNNNITAAIAYHPLAIILGPGSNDIAAGRTVPNMVWCLKKIDSAAKAAKVPFFVTTTQPRNITGQNLTNLAVMRDTIYKMFGTHAIGSWDPFANKDNTINAFWGAGDGIHLNDSAHYWIYAWVRDTLLHFGIPTGTAVVSFEKGERNSSRTKPLSTTSPAIRLFLAEISRTSAVSSDRGLTTRCHFFDINGRAAAHAPASGIYLERK
jgi:hypothetical protein